jgi:hypothetical protein
MRGTTPPLRHTSARRGAYLSSRVDFTFAVALALDPLACNSCINVASEKYFVLLILMN